MESLSLSHSVVNNLNATLAKNAKLNRHLQTGRRVIDNSDDAGALSVNARTNNSLIRNHAIRQNLQNALSFVQAQDGALSVVGKILLRASELKVKFESSLSDQATKQQYDEEFGEIQKELGQMAYAKWNGVSLFSVGATSVLLGTANDPHNLNADTGESTIAIQRSAIFDKFKIIRSPSGATAAVDSTGDAGEDRTTLNLLGPKGKLTWWQWPHQKPDHFKALHGTEVIHDKMYGNSARWPTMTMANGTSHTVTGSGTALKGNYAKYKDEIRFGDTGNQSSALTLIVNESDQLSSTGWEMEYQIEYDPYPLDLADKSRTWSLNDYDVSDFENFQEVLSTARAQNGAEQSRINHELTGLQAKQAGLVQAQENADGLDYSSAMTKYSRLRDKLHLNANLVAAAKEMENILYTDYLDE